MKQVDFFDLIIHIQEASLYRLISLNISLKSVFSRCVDKTVNFLVHCSMNSYFVY